MEGPSGNGDDSPAIVDFSVLETSKENVQPLAAGRKVTTLSALLATPHSQRMGQLSSTRHKLRINVELAMEADDDDPESENALEAYYRLVHWILESYPQGHSAESGLLETIEEATRVLNDYREGVYKSELKYLKLWVLFANYVERPSMIYKFLLANEIGTDHALFYEEYAIILERANLRKDADEIYELGIARRAEPLDHLERRRNEFAKRMMFAQAPSAGADTPPPMPASSMSRTILGGGEATTGTTRRGPAPTASEDVFTIRSTSTRPKPNGRMGVFMDPVPGVDGSAEGGATNEWADMGTRKTRVKENVPETGKIAGSTIRQPGKSRRVASGPPASMILPYRDPEPPSGGSKIVPFKDPEPEPSGSRSKILPFKDPPAKLVPFMDPEPSVPAKKTTQKVSGSVAGSSSLRKVPETTAKGFAPFVDEEESAAPVPATPKFMPFRDEDTATTQIAPTTTLGAVMTGKMKEVAISEAEALRKDPLKNYATEDH